MHELWPWRVNNITVAHCNFDVATQYQWLLVRLSWQGDNCKLFMITLVSGSDLETFSYKLNWMLLYINTQETCMEPHTLFRNVLYCLCKLYMPSYCYSLWMHGIIGSGVSTPGPTRAWALVNLYYALVNAIHHQRSITTYNISYCKE